MVIPCVSKSVTTFKKPCANTIIWLAQKLVLKLMQNPFEPKFITAKNFYYIASIYCLHLHYQGHCDTHTVSINMCWIQGVVFLEWLHCFGCSKQCKKLFEHTIVNATQKRNLSFGSQLGETLGSISEVISSKR